MAIGVKWHQIMTANGILNSGRAVWAHFEHPLVGHFGVIALYAPNIDMERAELWHEMAGNLDKNRKWFMAEDFNNVEDFCDRRGGSRGILTGREKRGWKIPLLAARVPLGTTGITRSIIAIIREFKPPLT